MSVVVPFLLLILSGGFAAYHRLRLAYWAAITASLLVVAWLLGANATATVIAALLVAAVSIPLLVPTFRKISFVSSTARSCRRSQSARSAARISRGRCGKPETSKRANESCASSSSARTPN